MNIPMNTDYSFSFESSKTADSIFQTLMEIEAWWSGVYGEEINGNSKKVNDEFEFRAGDGVHRTKQRLIELIPDKKIVWQVVESDLTFLEKPDEWTNTRIGFEISEHEGKTKVTFTHQGLIPGIECYEDCAGAWSKYMNNLAEKLK